MAASRGWNKAKVKLFREAFFDFAQHVQIVSKDQEGFNAVQFYEAQHRFLDAVFEGLSDDIHYFVCLKARQLGISTVVRMLIVFWAFMHEGLRVALIYDTDSHRNEARAEIKGFLERLPTSHSIRTKKGGDNRDYLEFENGSRVSFYVAGVKKSKGSGGLGRGRGANMAGCTEVSSWGDLEGVKAFERSLSDQHPNRLYIWESTARGFQNPFYPIWCRAKADDLTKKAIFIGWWAKESYSHAKDTALFERYGSYPPTEEEAKKIDLVKREYGHSVTMEQLAWYRHEFDPDVDHDSESEEEGDEITRQELPWHEGEAFIMTGSPFFSAEKLTDLMSEVRTYPYKGYRYFMSEHFESTQIEQVKVPRQMQLKVWKEPEPDGVYVIGADPAYGSSEESNQYCATVLRCYADSVEQVAEFCTVRMTTFQFAWVIAHLCGVYGNARLLLEINGPGAAVLNAFRELMTMAKAGLLPSGDGFGDMTHVFDHVRQYMYARQDSIHQAPSGVHWITSIKNKVQIMERFRDLLTLRQLELRSAALLEEMQTTEREGDSIHGSESNQDDRVMAMAMAIKCYEDSEKPSLRARGMTREMVARTRSATQADMQQLFSQSLVSSFFNAQQRERTKLQRAVRRGTRYRW